MNNFKEELVREATRTLLKEMGEDITREGLIDTPDRVARMWKELTTGLRSKEPKFTVFNSEGLDQMITILNMDYNSICEHHLVPFYGRAHIGYIPNTKIAGLSKFARVVDWYAARPQIQEVMTTSIAEFIQKKLKPKGLIVVVEGTHMCMSTRGVKKPNHKTITSAIKGDIAKDEFFDLLDLRR